jgi:hypothetical protein
VVQKYRFLEKNNFHRKTSVKLLQQHWPLPQRTASLFREKDLLLKNTIINVFTPLCMGALLHRFLFPEKITAASQRIGREHGYL